MAIEMVKQIYDVGGKGHSCGICSFNDDHIHQLALAAPVSRMMVRPAIQGQRRLLHQRHADDIQPGLRYLGR